MSKVTNMQVGDEDSTLRSTGGGKKEDRNIKRLAQEALPFCSAMLCNLSAMRTTSLGPLQYRLP